MTIAINRTSFATNMTNSSEDSFVLIEETANILHDDEDDPVIVDSNSDDISGGDIYESTTTTLPLLLKDQPRVFQIAPINLKRDFVHILEAKKTLPISPIVSKKATAEVLELGLEPPVSKNFENPVHAWHCCHCHGC